MSRCRPLTGRRTLGRMLCFLVLATANARGAERAEIPLEDRLTYSVSWLGVHCGEMTLESANTSPMNHTHESGGHDQPRLLRMIGVPSTTK